MLRHMVFKNFIQFKDFQSLPFNDGPTFFVGENSTGKSAVLELLRRCMSLDINASVSSSYDESKPSYAFCKFHLPRSGCFTHISEIWSGVDKRDENGKTFWTKIVCLRKREKRDDDSNTNIKSDNKMVIKSYKYDISQSRPINAVDELKVIKVQDIKWIENDKMVNDLVTLVKAETDISSEKLSDIWGLDDTTDAVFSEKLQNSNFLDELGKMYVSTMSMRSIGVLQWSRSKRIKLSTSDNYKDACERAEIISELIEGDHINKEIEKFIFQFLTYPSNFTFSKDGEGDISVSEEGSSSSFKLLKCPEGIIAAKQFSLIVAHKNFHTVCLEEPDHGMHPQMIERLRIILQWLLDKTKTNQSNDSVEAKAIIIVSHSPHFISRETVKRTFMFARQADKEKVARSIFSIKDISRVFTDTDDLKKLVFASKVLFVEGKTDKIVIECLFEHIMKDEIVPLEEKHHIISHHVVTLGSKTFRKTIENFYESKQCSFHRHYLLDRDAYIVLEDKKEKNESKQIIKTIEGQDFSKFKNDNMQSFLNDQEGFIRYCSFIQRENTFIWKYGELEDTIRKSLDKEDIKTFFGSNEPTSNMIKEKITKISEDDLTVLIEKIYTSEEIMRLIEFLKGCNSPNFGVVESLEPNI